MDYPVPSNVPETANDPSAPPLDDSEVRRQIAVLEYYKNNGVGTQGPSWGNPVPLPYPVMPPGLPPPPPSVVVLPPPQAVYPPPPQETIHPTPLPSPPANVSTLLNKAVITLCCVFFTIALGIGLGVGLRDASSGSGSVDGSSSSSSSGGTFTLTIQSANTKQTWMDNIAAAFNAQGHTLSSGQRLNIVVANTGSTLKASLQPTIWSPNSIQWVTLQEATDGTSYISNKATMCHDTTSIPVGIAMWKSKAEALGWPSQPISLRDLIALADDPTLGWSLLGSQYASWGRFTLGHGNPLSSNSGRLTIVAALQALSGSTAPLNGTFINSTAAHAGIHALENDVMHLGTLDTDLLDRMVLRGPSYLHASATYESNVIAYNTKYPYPALPEPFVFIYPSDGTLWMTNPLCIMDRASWTTDLHVEAARLFVDYALSPDSTNTMILSGVRPADASFDVTSLAGSPFSVSNGVIPSMNVESAPTLPYPTDAIQQQVIALWQQEKKTVVVFMALDTSGSMASGGDIPGVSPINALRSSASSFVSSLADNDVLSIANFGNTPTLWEGSGNTLALNRNAMLTRISGLYANGGTALFISIKEALLSLSATRANDIYVGISRNYLCLVETDGVDNGGGYDEMVAAFPSSTDPTAPHVFAIGFGSNADGSAAILQNIAEATNGKYFAATTSNLASIYTQILNEL